MYSYQKRESKLKKFLSVMVLIIFVAATSIFLYDMYLKIDVKSYEGDTTGDAVRLYEENNIEQESQDITEILEDVTKCVVGISKIKDVGESIMDSDSTSELGIGSGVIVSNNGYIITNWHVAGNKYSNCYVTLADGKMHTGEVMWADSDLDLAIVKINATNLNYLTLGDSDFLKLGQTVYAIGNPIGIEFQRTVTNGIISGLNRTIKIEDENEQTYMEDLIQTDASINTGNSGGPLINAQGEIIGINSVKIDSAEGIGFAIPINVIKPVIESFINENKFEEAYLGIFAYDKEVIPYLDSEVEFENGIYVVQISTDGPAANSGLRIGDIITKIDENEINKMSTLRNYIYQKNPKDKITLTINRQGKEYTLDLTLGKR